MTDDEYCEEVVAELYDRIAALTAERDEWRTKATEWNDPLGAASIAYHQQQLAEDRAEKAEAALAERDKDAERYRFMRSQLASEYGPVQDEFWKEILYKLCREEKMDELVDGVMKLLRHHMEAADRIAALTERVERQSVLLNNAVIATAKAEAALRQAAIVGWMVGDDPQHAAMYNAGERERAYDAAQRWGRPITALVLHPEAPTLDAAPTAAPKAKCLWPEDCKYPACVCRRDAAPAAPGKR